MIVNKFDLIVYYYIILMAETELYLPRHIIRNIVSYLPPPVVKPEVYGILETASIMNPVFGIIIKVTPKYIVYCKWMINLQYAATKIFNGICRKKIQKDTARRCYYIDDKIDGIMRVTNKIPSYRKWEKKEDGSLEFEIVEDKLTETQLINAVYNQLPRYKKDSIRWFHNHCPIKLED